MNDSEPGRAALSVLELAQAGRFADIRELFAPQLRPMVSADGLQAAWDAELGRRGPLTSVGSPRDQASPGGRGRGADSRHVRKRRADRGGVRHRQRLAHRHPAAAGHSLGGTVAPRVAAAEPSVAGLVILAGGTQPLHWAAVRQFRYLASLDPGNAAAAEPAIAAITRQANLVDSPGLSPATPDSELPFGIPAAYWLDLRGYDPAALGKPILIVAAGRDYQATVAEDLAGWRSGLAGRPDVTIRVYEADNHLFFPGTGPPAPAEYEPAQHLDPEVAEDIADWLTSGALAS